MLREKCGVVGIHSNSGDVSPSLFYGLYALQHRGQESCGITTFDTEFHTKKGMGLVPEFFDFEKLSQLKGPRGIGHLRYSTTGESRIECAQPIVVTHPKGTLAIAHNGNIVNCVELKETLEDEPFVSTTDTEVIARLIVRRLAEGEDIVASITDVMKELIGSYSITILTDDELIAVRDPLGVRPLCLGEADGTTIVASESVVFDVLNVSHKRDIEPGEILVMSGKGMKSHRPVKLDRRALCMFEYVYFARPDSVLNGILAYDVREKIGTLHAMDDDVEVDFVSPIPDSAIPFSLGYSRARGVPYVESLIRNRYVGRTFILPDQQARELAVRLKLNPMLSNVEGKRIVLFDDSIVRGTTSGRIIGLLKEVGAAEVHMRIGCPPIRSLCRLGIDMPTDRELIASDKSVEGIRRHIGADSLKYLGIEDLKEAIGMGERELCMGCLTERYPVEITKSEALLRESCLE
ncbi:MAG: amidophosphoribosyltransferase [Thermoplasmata archaeon]